MMISQRIKELRLFKKHMNRDEFARAIVCKPLCVYNWEKDRSTPSLKSIDSMLKVFDMTYEEFMKGVELK